MFAAEFGQHVAAVFAFNGGLRGKDLAGQGAIEIFLVFVWIDSGFQILYQFMDDVRLWIAGQLCGGIIDILPRVLPSSCVAVIQKGSWEVPPIFTFLQEAGKLSKGEMMRTFNNGIGIILVVPDKITESVQEFLRAMGEKAYVIGTIAERETASNQIAWA